MVRKVFMSFLGAIPYFPTRYYEEIDRRDLSNPIYYVQEAILRKHPVEEVFIFTTKEAHRNNYQDRIYREGQVNKWAKDEGLRSVLSQLKKEGRLHHYHDIEITNGYSEAEIWMVFQKVFEQLQDGDEVIFDITFGFRSLPMLVIVLLNYARTLRNVKIEAIYYGNYEAGRAEKDAQLAEEIDDIRRASLTKMVVEAPILDLRAFSVLQEWTHAAQSFEDGNMTALTRLTAGAQPEFSNELLGMSQAIQTCRGQALYRDLDVDHLKHLITDLSGQSDIAVQLQPLLNKVGQKLAPFHSRQLANGFAAVEWCLQHGMIQQGITFLQESLQSYVIERTVGEEFVCDRLYRYAANGALGGYKSPKRTVEEKNRMELPLSDEDVKEFYKVMYQLVRSYPGLSIAYKQLTGDFRNDINHCGFRLSYATPQALGTELQNIYDTVSNLKLFEE